jgi:hypothetical protein
MIKVTTVLHRDKISTPWYRSASTHKKNVNRFIDSGVLERIWDDNGWQTATLISFWKTQNDMDEYLNLPETIESLKDRSDYDLANNITSTTTIEIIE